jgi:L-aspartate oxidase
MKAVTQDTDFIVVGAGVAGLRAAISLAEKGRVLVLAKQELSESATQYAQGGIAVALSDEDDISIHLQDTLDAGDGLCNPEAVKVLVEEGPERIQELIDWGTQFDRKGTTLTFTRARPWRLHRTRNCSRAASQGSNPQFNCVLRF